MVPLIPENAAAQWQGGTNSLPPHPYSKQQNQQANSMPRLREQGINILDPKNQGKRGTEKSISDSQRCFATNAAKFAHGLSRS